METDRPPGKESLAMTERRDRCVGPALDAHGLVAKHLDVYGGPAEGDVAEFAP